MGKHSKMYAKIKKWFDELLWTLAMVRNAVTKRKITADEFSEITGKSYEEVSGDE